MEDAAALVEESFGEELKFFAGECFVTVSEEQATEHVEKLIERKQAETEAFQENLEQLEREMKDLKTYLYAKFGNSINLDEQDD